MIDRVTTNPEVEERMRRKKTFKKAVVTGGSSGIGLAIARSLAADGADLLLIGRREGHLEKARRLGLQEAPTGTTITILPLDITDGNKVAEDLAPALDNFGTPDLLVNSAGIAKVDYIENHTMRDFSDIVDVNLKGIFHVFSVVGPRMRTARAGTIVNLSSTMGFSGMFGNAAYAATKFGIVGLSSVMRCELKPHGIDVHVFFPCDTYTPQLVDQDLPTRPPELHETAKSSTIYSADQMATVLFRGLRRGHYFIIGNAVTTLLWYLERFVPWFVRGVYDGDIKRARKRIEKGTPPDIQAWAEKQIGKFRESSEKRTV